MSYLPEKSTQKYEVHLMRSSTDSFLRTRIEFKPQPVGPIVTPKHLIDNCARLYPGWELARWVVLGESK